MQAGPERPYTQKLVAQLEKAGRKGKAPLWIAVARRLKGPARKRPQVNLSELGRYTPKGKVALVPGKLLSMGRLDRAVTVAAFAASKQARAKVEAAGGKVIKIEALLAQDPKGSGAVLVT